MEIARSATTIPQYVAKFDMAHFLNENLLRHLQLFHFPAYANVYRAMDEQHYLYFLVEGTVQCSHYHLNGRIAVFAHSTPFAAIGDLEILTEEPVWSNVVATQKTTMLGIARDIVEHYGAEDPRFLRFLIDQLRQKLYKTNSLQINQVLPAINRFAMYLLAQQRSSDNDQVVLPDKEELASLLGTTPRHLNRLIKQLVEAGAIDTGYPALRLLDRSFLINLPQ